ncbi:hypothetical protein, partial [Pseudoalteromonas 'SMAR']|uniref:hypothetical protein n=1 Tax=Pseudoalteromonas 'SMAR' TaxID=3416908 RepID=UPI003AF31208
GTWIFRRYYLTQNFERPLNPWLFNIYEALFVSLLAAGLTHLFIITYWGSFFYTYKVEFGFSSLYFFSFLILSTHFIAAFSLRWNFVFSRKSISQSVTSLLFVTGAYGFFSKLIVASIFSFLTFLYYNSSVPDVKALMQDYSDVSFIVALGAVLIVFLCMIYEFYIYCSLVRLSGSNLNGLDFSKFRLVVLSFVLIFGPTIYINYWVINEFLVLFSEHASEHERTLAKLVYSYFTLIIVGLVVFSYIKNKSSILKCATMTALFINLPVFTSVPEGVCNNAPHNIFESIIDSEHFSNIEIGVFYCVQYISSVALLSYPFVAFTLIRSMLFGLTIKENTSESVTS